MDTIAHGATANTENIVIERLRERPGFRACGENQYEACCPAHEDRRASLSIGLADGKVLLHCHAGCETDTILQSLGLSSRDLFLDGANGHHDHAERRVGETYDYTDESGQLSYQVVRFDPKDFRQRKPDGNGGWNWSVKGLKRLPYRLPDLAGTEYVFIVEGEKDVDNLRKIGLTATCNSGGAGKWTSELTQYFRPDQHVTILPDNDEPGRKHAEQLAQSLSGHVASIKILELAGLPAKGDVSDWLQARDADEAKSELKRLARAAPEWQPTPLEQSQNEERRNKFNRTDSGNAKLFSSMFKGQVKYDHGRHRWLLFRLHRWQEDVDGEIIRLAQVAARRRYQLAAEIPDLDERKREASFAISSETRGKIDSALALAQAERELADSGANWNRDPLLFCAGNGVVLLDSGTLREEFPSDGITLHTAVPFDPSAKCPRWEQFLNEIFLDNPEVIPFIRRAVGYSMSGDTSEQVLFLLYGVGSNGKSVFLGIIREALGEYSYNMPFSTIELHERSAIPNDLAALVDRRFVTAAETNATAKLNEARIKALTGGDPITARFLHCEFFTYKPVAKFWLSVNHKPRVSDDSYGFWRRVRLIPFTREFRGAEADPRLEEKLRAELPGVLAWAVRGSLEWKRSGLNPPECVTAATEQYRLESDPLAEFIAERCIEGSGMAVTGADFYRAYTNWTADRGMKDSERLTSTAFGTRMSQRFQNKKSMNGKVYYGVGLRT